LTRGSQKIKEQVLTLDCKLSKFIKPVLNLNWGSKKSKNLPLTTGCFMKTTSSLKIKKNPEPDSETF
jgi:hypothetical protein